MTKRDNITVLCVPPTHFGKIMPFCWGTITRGLQLCDMGCMGDVVTRIEGANLQVWLVTDGNGPLATCFTDINEEANGSRFVAVYGLAGKRITKWARQLSDTLAAFARDERCSRVMFQGRPGWARLLPEYKPVRQTGGEWVWERAVAH